MVNLYRRKGPEILVNTETLNNQGGNALSLLPGGGFVVVWSDNSGIGGDTSGYGIKAQLFDANGAKVGSEFLVNTQTNADQTSAIAVATLPSGRFVITWTSYDSVGGGEFFDSFINARIFEANGTPVGADFQVNTSAAGFQIYPAITELSGGGFVATWLDSDDNGDVINVKAQLFDAGGTKVGGEIVVNTGTTNPNFSSSAVLALSGGGFAVTWSAADQKLQLFDAAGTKVGGVLTVSAADTGAFTASNINALGSGFIVTWAQQDNPGGSPATYDLHAQRYDAAGNKIGAEILVNTYRVGNQNFNDAHELPGGGFLIVWQGPAPFSSNINIYGQVFDSNGGRVGGEFVVTATTSGDEQRPRIDILPSGDIVVVYNDSDGDASGTAVRMQILTPANSDAPTDLTLSDNTYTEVAIENLPVATISATMGGLNSTPIYTIVGDPTFGAFRIEGNQLVVADSALLNLPGASPGTFEIRIRVTDSQNGQWYEESFNVTIQDVLTESRYSAGDETLVNTATPDFTNPLDSAALGSGGYVVISSWQDGISSGYRAQLFEATGGKVGTEINLDIPNSGGADPVVTALSGGGFVVAYGPVGTNEIRAQRYDASGNEVGTEIVVNTDGNGANYGLSIATLASGNFVVTWTDPVAEPGGSGAQVIARIFEPDGDPVGAEFRVNTGIDGEQRNSHVAALPGGGFVVTWVDETSGRLEGQRFDAAGNTVGAELVIATGITRSDTDLAVLSDGRFVVLYANLTGTVQFPQAQLRAQIVGADGVNVGSSINVGNQAYTDGLIFGDEHVTATVDGGFVVTWSGGSTNPAFDGDVDSRARFFDGNGQPIGEQINVSDVTNQLEGGAVTVLLANGSVAFSWYQGFTDNGQAQSNGVTRVFDYLEPPGPPVATPGPDTLDGTEGNDTIDGLAGNDVINGYVGNDILIGNDGNDQLHGGEDNDTLQGGADNDELWGDGGNDILDGGTGADIMRGGSGDDIYYVDDFGDQVFEGFPGGDLDRIITSVNFRILDSVSVERIDAAEGSAAFRIDGNNVANTLIGNSSSNFLDGGGGSDRMQGGDGNDTYIVDYAGDVVTELQNQGFDALYTFVSFTLANDSHVEWLSTIDNNATTAINLTGSTIGQYLIGNMGDNVLDGRQGADFMQGFAGNDIYYVDHGGDAPVEVAGQGFDSVYASMSYGLAAGTEIEWLSTVSTTATSPINLLGNEFAQYLIGNNGANSLDGAGGADTMIGYGGNDTYIVDQAGDQVIEAVGGGFDAIYTTSSFALGAGSEVEWLSASTVGSTTAMNLSGNEFVNYVLGNNGANTLNGGGGSDFLYGYGGADIFQFTTALGASNVDALMDFVSGTDKIALDDAIFTAIGAPGALNANAFVTGSAAGDADDRIIYNSATGQLFYDADGNGAGAAVLFATLSGNPALSASDFQVI